MQPFSRILLILVIITLSNGLQCLKFNFKDALGNVAWDVFEINKSLVSINTLNILCLTVPIYVVCLNIDQKLNYLFYDKKTHMNIKQFTNFNNIDLSNILLTGSISLSSLVFFSNNQEVKIASYSLMLGLCSMGLFKKIIKLIKWQNSIRPYNGNFVENKIYYGGFPSGHLMTMAYLSTIWLNQIGLKYSFPFIMATGYMFIDYIVKNRHYISQLIAGATLGLTYGCAVNLYTNKRLNRKLGKHLKINFDIVKLDLCNKKVSIRLSYDF